MTLQDLITRHGAASLDKQDALADLIGERGWGADLSTGQITFGDDYAFPIQMLGTESFASGTWLWGWANEASHIPEPLLRASQQVRAYGEQHGVAEFVQAQYELDEVGGHLPAMIASGLCNADAYYRGPYGQGAAFFLLTAPALREPSASSVVRIPRIFNTFIGQFDCDHRAALTAYAEYKGYSCEDRGPEVVCTSPRDGELRATFDDLGRMTEMNMQMRPTNAAPAPKRKPWWNFGR